MANLVIVRECSTSIFIRECSTWKVGENGQPRHRWRMFIPVIAGEGSSLLRSNDKVSISFGIFVIIRVHHRRRFDFIIHRKRSPEVITREGTTWSSLRKGQSRFSSENIPTRRKEHLCRPSENGSPWSSLGKDDYYCVVMIILVIGRKVSPGHRLKRDNLIILIIHRQLHTRI